MEIPERPKCFGILFSHTLMSQGGWGKSNLFFEYQGLPAPTRYSCSTSSPASTSER